MLRPAAVSTLEHPTVNFMEAEIIGLGRVGLGSQSVPFSIFDSSVFGFLSSQSIFWTVQRVGNPDSCFCVLAPTLPHLIFL